MFCIIASRLYLSIREPNLKTVTFHGNLYSAGSVCTSSPIAWRQDTPSRIPFNAHFVFPSLQKFQKAFSVEYEL